MKRLAILTLTALCAALALQAETYVKGVHHIGGGYRYGRDVPTLDILYEWWFGPDRAVLSSTGWRYDYSGNTDWRLVWDKGRGRVIVIDLTAKTYLEVPMGAGPEKFVDAQGMRWIPQFKIYGTAAATGRTLPLLGRPCREFETAEWQIRNDEDRFYDRRRKLLVSSDVSFNWRLADELFLWVSRLFNPQPDYLASLDKIGGFILASEEEASEGGSLIAWTFRVIDIKSEQAPESLFLPPPGFKKIEELNVEALFKLRGVVHICPLY